MDRNDLEACLKSFYKARVEGDMDALGEAFAQNAKFQIVGSPEFSMLAASAEGHEEVIGLLRTIADSFELYEFAFLDLLIDGNNAAIRWRARVQNVTSGDSFTTELADFIEIDGGKIISVNEFLDTALAG